MLAALPVLGLTVVMVWNPPELDSGWMIGWEAVALLGFYTAFTMYLVPHLSLGAELSTDHHDRSRIFGVQSAFFSFGMIFAFAGMQYVTVSDDPRSAAGQLAMAFVPFALLVLLIPPLRVRERPEYQGKGSENPIRALKDVLTNEYARRLLAVQFIQMLGIGVIGVLAPYQFQYVLRRPDLIGPLPALFFLFSVASIAVWVRLSRRYGKRDVWVVAMLIAGVAFGFTFFVGEGDVMLIALIMPLAGIGLGCGGVVGPSLLADVIDADELATGERKEGAYNAAWGFALKSSNALMILVTSLVLQAIGFEPNVEQSDFAKLAIRGLYGVMPFSMFLLAAAVLRGFRLDEAEHAGIRAQLDARRG
jgi:GPH family glycoside/pentoside/hexuronide:cation symporter